MLTPVDRLVIPLLTVARPVEVEVDKEVRLLLVVPRPVDSEPMLLVQHPVNGFNNCLAVSRAAGA